MNREFKMLEIYPPWISDYQFKVKPLRKINQEKGYVAFYYPNYQYSSSWHNLENALFKLLAIDSDDDVLDPLNPLVDPFIPQKKKLYALWRTTPDAYVQNTFKLFRALREYLANATTPKGVTYGLHEAGVFDIFADQYLQSSPVIANTLGYKEYLLWDDGGLWTQAAWENERKNLADKPNFSPKKAEQRLAWQGAGWLSQHLENVGKNETAEWFVPPDLEQLCTANMERLLRHEQALVNFYQNTEKRKPPAYNPLHYIRLLCNFLPDHRSFNNSEIYLSSNSLGDPGGPRLWQGFQDWRLNMQLIHLLLDGWLTLWPKDPGNPDGTKLYLQPANLAVLYWAARKADMPYTESPQRFLKNYQWHNADDPSSYPWFGGRCKYWIDNDRGGV